MKQPKQSKIENKQNIKLGIFQKNSQTFVNYGADHFFEKWLFHLPFTIYHSTLFLPVSSKFFVA